MENVNKTAVITGISSGIGLALAKKLLAEGYQVIGTTRSGKLEGLTDSNLNIVALQATDEASVAEATGKIAGGLTGGIDLLINNAGTALDVASVEPDRESFNQTMATNVTGPVFFTEPLLDAVKEGGQIVFISSSWGLLKNAESNAPAYRVSKAAINMYAKTLAKRLAERNITVAPVHPGWVQTKLGGDQAPFTAEQSAEKIYEGIAGRLQNGEFYNIEIAANETL